MGGNEGWKVLVHMEGRENGKIYRFVVTLVFFLQGGSGDSDAQVNGQGVTGVVDNDQTSYWSIRQ